MVILVFLYAKLVYGFGYMSPREVRTTLTQAEFRDIFKNFIFKRKLVGIRVVGKVSWKEREVGTSEFGKFR